jgi:hypothetical protein
MVKAAILGTLCLLWSGCRSQQVGPITTDLALADEGGAARIPTGSSLDLNGASVADMKSEASDLPAPPDLTPTCGAEGLPCCEPGDICVTPPGSPVSLYCIGGICTGRL